MTTVPISLTTLAVGPHVVGPATVNTTWSDYLLTIDRTVANGLNSKTTATSLKFSVEHSVDGGTNWRVLSTGGISGGAPNPDASPGIGGHFSPPLSSGLVRVTVTVAGTSVAVAGTLTVT